MGVVAEQASPGVLAPVTPVACVSTVLLATLIVPSTGRAQTELGWPDLSGAIVEIRFDAAPSEDRRQLEILSGLMVGEPFRALEIRKAVRRLYQLGRFENVFVRAAPADNGVVVNISLPPRRVIRSFDLESDVLDEDEALAAMQAAAGDRFDPNKLSRWQAALDEGFGSSRISGPRDRNRPSLARRRGRGRRSDSHRRRTGDPTAAGPAAGPNPQTALAGQRRAGLVDG